MPPGLGVVHSVNSSFIYLSIYLFALVLGPHYLLTGCLTEVSHTYGICNGWRDSLDTIENVRLRV